MNRILGLDYGEKTIGVAVSDPFMLFAQGLEVLRRQDEKSIRKSIQRLSEIIRDMEINEIVLGYPKNLNNTEGDRCQKTLLFKERLTENFNLPVILWDERLSTIGATHSISLLSRKKQKAVVDKMAAVYILQGYLDLKNREKSMNDPLNT